MPPKIAVIYSMARSGGTLISRCLGCMPGHILLSEIHPRWSWFNPLVQAHEWFNLISKKEIKQAQSIKYIDAIRLISQRCLEKGQQLIIRDWSHVDFIPGSYPVPPVYRLSQYELLKDYFDIRHIAIVRHPLDALLSLALVKDFRDRIDVSLYLEGLRHFARLAAEIGFIRYEDFCDTPPATMEKICRTLDLTYDPGFSGKFHLYTTVTGDTTLPGQQHTLTGDPVGKRSSNVIRRPPQRPAPPELLKRIESNKDYREILEILGYPAKSL